MYVMLLLLIITESGILLNLINGFQADAMIALPGGYGTFEELLEMITW